MYSTGHGDIELSPDGRGLYYVHHGRPTPTDPQRRLYTDRMRFAGQVFGKPGLAIDQSTSDEPVPSGVAPYRIRAGTRTVHVRAGAGAPLRTRVTSADGARLALQNPLNRVATTVADPGVATVVVRAGGALRVIGNRPGTTTIRLTYQRLRKNAGYRSVTQAGRLVATTVRVRVSRR
jgi:hypothetical protein